jgi:hypothetical protein
MDKLTDWLRLRVREPSTWAGLAMIAVVLGSDPMQAHAIAQGIALVIGGGLMAAGPMPEVRDQGDGR